jgi:hypothetical protein
MDGVSYHRLDDIEGADILIDEDGSEHPYDPGNVTIFITKVVKQMGSIE